MSGDTASGVFRWRPLSVRSSTETADKYDELVDGVPPWLDPSLGSWAAGAFGAGGMPRVGRADRRLKRKDQMAAVTGAMNVAGRASVYWSNSTGSEKLDIVDFLLADLEQDASSARRTTSPSDWRRAHESFVLLDEMLAEAGSLWTPISEPCWGLVRRVSVTSQEQVTAATSAPTDSARKLASAWHACYRHRPDYDAAYGDAVLAVEAVALPTLIPRDSDGTLGKAIGALRTASETWTVSGLDVEGKVASGTALLSMLQVLWHNQERHAKSDGSIRNVTSAEAEAAVNLAVTLVQWFSAGMVTRR